MRKVLITILILPFVCMMLAAMSLNADPVSQREIVDVSDEAAVKTEEDSTIENWASAQVFVRLPSDLLELIHPSTRQDMADYYMMADSVWEAPNKLGGVSKILEMKEDYLKVQVTDVSTLEICMLHTKKNDLAAVAYTIDGGAADSELYLFSFDDMQPLSTKKYFEAPELKDFFDLPKGSITKMDEIEQMVGFTTMEYRFDKDNHLLRAYLTIDKHINQDDYNIIKLFIRDEVVYEWNGKKFKKVKNKK